MSNELIITGASSCLGLDLLKNVNKDNTIVHAVIRNQKNFKDLTSELNQKKINYYEFIHSNYDQIGYLMQSIFDQGNPNSIIIFNGDHHIKPLRSENFDSINRIFFNNVVIPMLIAKEFTKFSKKKKIEGASIIFVSSTAALKGEAGLASYSAAKGALLSLTKSLSKELSSHGVRVNTISPGWIKSKRSDKVTKIIPSESFQSIENNYPLGFGSPLDTSEAIKYLISKEAKWVTGQNFIIDGGFTA
tara:strand:- start:3716 stop:4453 length:738 start_codon:yes stop_codon:yes gene_type:complete